VLQLVRAPPPPIWQPLITCLRWVQWAMIAEARKPHCTWGALEYSWIALACWISAACTLCVVLRAPISGDYSQGWYCRHSFCPHSLSTSNWQYCELIRLLQWIHQYWSKIPMPCDGKTAAAYFIFGCWSYLCWKMVYYTFMTNYQCLTI